MNTSAQRTKFEKFQQQEMYEAIVRFINEIVSAAGLSLADRGVTWGVTVCPDTDTLVRLNVGNVAQLSVMKGIQSKDDPTGKEYSIMVAVVKKSLGMRGAPSGMRVRSGFTRHVEDSIILVGDFNAWSGRLASHKRVVRAMQAHIAQATRRMPDTNWHNPLVNQLLDEQ